MKPGLKRIEAALAGATSSYAPPLGEPDEHTATPPPDLFSLSDRPLPPQPSDLLTPVMHPKVEPSPNLPEFADSTDRYPFVALTNAALAINLLKDLQGQVEKLLANLESTLQQIQAVYDEGPIVEGWLESSNPTDPVHAMYRLCGLSNDGQIWYRHCPPEQVADVSLAIARYQRLQALLQHKHRQETLLGRLTTALVNLHSQLGE